jgi:transcriptional regulator with XRE-family HTH domain
MTAKNTLTTAPPYAVEQALKRLGANLRTARLRRNLTIENVAEKIGTGPRPVSDAERGKPSTSAAVYIALLWAYDLLEQMSDVAGPATDAEGLALSLSRDRSRARERDGLGSDF